MLQFVKKQLRSGKITTESVCKEKEYLLTYEDGSEAQFLPGTDSFLDLKTYREVIGKEYRRITFFLCTQEDETTAEKSKTFD